MNMQRKEGFVVRIKIKDETGKVVGETDAVTFKGLLALAHEEGLRSIRTRLLQVPTEENGRTAIVRARVRTSKGTFTGVGDAAPTNVNRRIAPHVIRMAETRATARALRLAVNIGEVAIEELADDVEIQRVAPQDGRRTDRPVPTNGDRRTEARPAPPASPANTAETAPPDRFRGRDNRPTDAAPDDRRAMSEEQRKLLFRLAFDLGETRETARERVLKALGVPRFETATRPTASKAIDALKRELAAKAAMAPPPDKTNGGADDIPF